ncbi:AraC family transcriptional regulator [Paenibacillus harenae]|uniref:AraC-like DNA-binding protein n=1 Tax=Paenibacillus harenae TaxID=306543 RepID=A0ABT9TYM8_PAEHA|nr:AraC family transcriptional regulator [Paenibacillus harenae]MDQ0111848.1 AraC-like DNA-binding protein [Paenibacillus harenae]
MRAYSERSYPAWSDSSVRLFATPSAFAKASLFYVQEIGYFETLERYFTEREQLDSYLVVYTIAGSGRLTYRGTTYPLTARQLFFIDCMDYQHYRAEQGQSWDMLWVHFNGSAARAYYEQFASSAEPVLTLQTDTPVPALLRRLLELHSRKSFRTELVGSQLLTQLLTELVLTAQQLELPNADTPSYIGEISLWMDEHYADKLSLAELAAKHAVNKYHFAKQFKRFTGFSPNEYLINTRITRAKELLKYSDLPIAEIAVLVGIDNVSHFISLFKDRVEQTPLVYRKKWRQASN